MRTIEVEKKCDGDGNVIGQKFVHIPDNCQHRQIWPPLNCKAPHRSNPECDCRWCVFNKEFNKANIIPSINPEI